MRGRYQVWAVIAALALVAGTAWAAQMYSSGINGVSVTATPAVIPFGFNATAGYVYSRAASANSCTFELVSGVLVRVEPGASVPFTWPSETSGLGGYPTVTVDCPSAQTATFDIVAIR
jgi:hypothetical protein